MSKRINKIKSLFLMVTLVLSSVVSSDLFATHIVGSDMTFECLGNDFYQVNLTVRRDCVNGADDAQFDDPAFVGIFDFLGNPLDFLGRFGMIEMPIVQMDTIFPGRPACGYFGSEVCVTEARYQATVYLPFRDGGYVLGYQRCCRNITLNNIVEPLNTGNTSFVCLTEPTLTSCNSSPAFQDWPEILICVNEPLVFDHPAVDSDGDSLSYMLYTPHAGASEARPKPVPPPGPTYSEIEWAEGYGLDNLLGGEPLRVDPVTGTVTATPNTVGQFLVGILVTEWRDGKVLSKTRRNFEYNVRACQDVADLDFEAPAATCDGLSVTFNNTSGDNYGFNWNFDASSSDPAFQSTEESPTFNYPQEGFYTVTLSSTNPETDCEVVVSKRIAVFNSTLSSDFTASATKCVGGKQTVRFTSTAIEPNEDLKIDSFKWEIEVNDVVIPLYGDVVSTEIECVDSIKVSHFVISSSGCDAQIMRMIALDDIIDTTSFIDLVGDTIRICIGSSTPLLNSAPEGVVYTWTPTEGLTFSDDELRNAPIASPEETTLYTVTATDGINTDEATVLVIVDMFPEFDFGVDSIELCRSGSQIPTIDGSAEYQYDWSPSDQVNTSNPYAPNDPLFSPRDEGYFYVTVTNGACQIVDSIYVTPIGNDPVALDAALVITEEITTNADGTITLNVPINWEELAQQFDIDSVYWTITTDSEMFSGSGMDISASFNPTSMATVCVYIVDTDGCTTKITRVVDFLLPTIIFISNDTIRVCLGDTSFIVSNPNSEWTYTWEPEEGLIFDDPNDRSNPRISPSESRYYYVTVSDGTSTIMDSIFIQSIDELIDIEIVSGEICSGVAQVTAQNSANDDSIEYEWSLDPNFETIIASGASVEIPLENIPATIYVRVVDPLICGNTETSITLNQDDYGIVADVTPINTCINNDGSVSLIIPDSVDVDILWTASDNITSEDLTSSDIDIVALDEQSEVTLMYQVTDAEGCVSTFTVIVPVNEELTVDVQGDTESCSTTGSFFASANANIDSVDFEWSLDPDFGTILSTADSVTADLGETGIIYLRGTAGTCESNVDEHMLNMKDLQLDADAPNRICLGDTADVELIIPDNSNYTITWDDADEIISTSGPIVVINAIGGKDTIVLSYTADDGEGCSFMDEVRIPYSTIIDPNPMGNVECGTQNMNFMIDPIYQDGDVYWDFGVINGDSVSSTLSNPTIEFDTSGIYMATISSTMETCNFEPTDFTFEVPEILEITTDQDLDQLVCGDSQLNLGALSDGNEITWTDDSNNILAVGDSVLVDAAGLSTIIATVTDSFGCTMELRYNITMYMFDVTTDAPTEAECSAGQSLVINATDNTGADLSYMWSSAAGILSGADSSSVTVDPANAGDLVLTVTNNELGCSEDIAVPIELGSIDASINSSNGTTLDFGDNTTLTVTPTGDNYTYEWEDGSTDPTREIVPTESGTTTYTVTVTDTDTGCTGEASITITVNEPLCADDGSVYLPTAFSPNSDGENDVLIVRGNGLQSVDLQVVDRWGKEVFRGTVEGEGWNGRHKNTGKELSPDVFAFCLRVVCDNGTEILRRGQVNLIR